MRAENGSASRRFLFGLAFATLSATFPSSPCAAQSHPGAFVGGELLLATNSDPTPDPPGSGYLIPYYHGAVEWPVAGVRAEAGGFIAKRWSLGGEFVWRAPVSGAFSGQSMGHSDRSVIRATLTSRESLISAIVRLHARLGSRVDLQPAGGITISMSEQSFTDRTGASYYPGYPPYPYTLPDVQVRKTRWGIVGGADAVFVVHPHVGIVASGRLHWIRRDNGDPYTRTTPGIGTLALQIGGGVRWQSR